MLVHIAPIERLTYEAITVHERVRCDHDGECVSKTRVQRVVEVSLSRERRCTRGRSGPLGKHVYSSEFRLVGKTDTLGHECEPSPTRPAHRAFSCKLRPKHRHGDRDFVFSLEKCHPRIMGNHVDERTCGRHRIGGIEFQSGIHSSLCNSFVTEHKFPRRRNRFETYCGFHQGVVSG